MLSAAQLRELETVREASPAVWGWNEDQCWTLARIAEVIRRRFKVGYTLAGVDRVECAGSGQSGR